ncbi:MAG: hypothetical protein EOP59_18220, partial [Sphingomonadales bacterium]
MSDLMLTLRRAVFGAFALCAPAMAQAVIAIDQFNVVPRSTVEGAYFSASSFQNRQFGAPGGANSYSIYSTQTQSLTVGVTGTLDRVGVQLTGATASRVNLSITRGYLYNPDGSGVDD